MADADSTSTPIKLPDGVTIYQNPFLNTGDRSGWVIESNHVVHIKWDKSCYLPDPPGYKRGVETVVAEAAVLKGQSEVEILQAAHKHERERRGDTEEEIFYDRHASVYFRSLDRKAHVYVYVDEAAGVLALGREPGRRHLPSVVFC